MDTLALYVAILAALLSSPNFDTRERASSLLHQTPPPVLFLLAQSRDPEVRHRVAPFASEAVWRELDGEWAGRWPWVDAIEGLPWQGMDMPHVEGYPHEHDWPQYKEATRIWARWQVMRGADLAGLRGMLLETEKRCQFWRANKRYP